MKTLTLLLGALWLFVGCSPESPAPGSSPGQAQAAPAAVASAGGPASPSFPPLPPRGPFLQERFSELQAQVTDPQIPGGGDDPRVEDLLEQFRSLDPTVRAAALEEVEARGSAALPALLRAVESDGFDYERAALLDGIGRVGDASAHPVLLRLVSDDESATIRAFAAGALGEIGDDRVLPDLVLRLKYEQDGFVVDALCSAMHELGLVAGVGKLLANLDGRIRVRQDAAEVLSRMLGDRFQYDTWAYATERTEAALSMRRWWWLFGDEFLLQANQEKAVGPPLEKRIVEAIFELKQYQMRNVDDARWILEGLGTVGIPYLCLGVTDENQYIRAHSVEVFVRMGLPGRAGRDTLHASVGDPLLRADVIRALGGIRDRESLPLFFSALGDPAIDVRICAVDALGQLGEAAALPVLQEVWAAGTDSHEFRTALAFSLALLGDDSQMPEVIAILDSEAPVGLWDLAARTDRLVRSRARQTGEVPPDYPFDGSPEEKVAFLRRSLQ